MSNQNWLRDIPGNRRLYNIVIPGSHDAGVYGVSISTRSSPASWARCQGSNIYNQAMSGSRMFDCRVFLKKEHGVLTPTMGHFFREKWGSGGETGRGGAYGGTFITCVRDAIAYVKTYPSEFLILRFSHTYCPQEVGGALNALLAEGDNRNYVSRYGGNIAQRRLHNLRGKVIMIFASEFHTNFNHRTGYLPFYKYADGTQTTQGLCTCGIYKGTDKMKTVHATAVRAFDEHKNHAQGIPDHLHFVYWQQTVKGGNIKKKTLGSNKTKKGVIKSYSGGAHDNLHPFINEIFNKVEDGDWLRPNVISHDFVTEQSCSQIIALNHLLGRP